MTNAPDDFRDTRDDREMREPRRNDRREMKLDSRIPPHNVDAEASLLGSMMLDDNPVGLAIERELQSADFYKPAHQNIFGAIKALAAAAQAIDPVTVADELRRTGMLDEIGGLDALLELAARLEVLHDAALVADEVVVMRGLAGDIGMPTIGEVDALDEPSVGEQLEEAEDGGPPDAEAVRLGVGEEVCGGEVPATAADQGRQVASRPGQADPRLVERLEHLPCHGESLPQMRLSIIWPERGVGGAVGILVRWR